MKYLVVFSLLLVSSLSWSESYSNVSIVKGLTIGATHARVQLESMKLAEGCSNIKFYFLDIQNNKEMFSSILAAKASGQKVSFQLLGCENDTAKISHVYLCDTQFCS
ncbi:hypothetical protein [Shewanella salipaludis]|uniref:DUF3718 domain-containing protein n=1 Tax=Shewanella salipaludis TaxID=2723052 RepID=A0A972FYD2_9GAMM|nr:hypothetical protein [Shewanella salipaludis]NMH63824.1 hypothetical protein [Shewanella salipaludis]